MLLENRLSKASESPLRRSCRSKLMLALVAALALVVPTACGSSSSKSTTASASASATSPGLAAIDAAVKKLESPVNGVQVNVPKLTGLPSLKGKKLLIVPSLGVIFNPAIGVITNALKPLGLTVQECDGQANPSTMASCMDQAPTIHNLAGVMTIGVPVQQTSTAYALLASHHIPVAAVQEAPNGAKSVVGQLGFVSSSAVLDAGIKASEDYVIDKSDGKANVLALGDDDSPDVIQASNYMVSYFKANCPDCVVASKQLPAASEADATPLVSSKVLSDPKFDWVVSIEQDSSGAAVAKGLQSAHATTKVTQGGTGVGLGSMQEVAQGTAGFVAAVAGGLNSWNWADAMLRVIAKQPIPTNYPVVIRLFDASNIHSIKITPQESQTFDWFGTANYPQQYDKIWGVK